VKTLSVSEAASDLPNWLKQAVAGEDIRIRSGNQLVALHPISSSAGRELLPREALRQLQTGAHLTPAQAESYLQEVRAERLAVEKHSE
jgi:antitoxin (DNA-binding transcriptional repressor) of toxin-antitoxin stability system